MILTAEMLQTWHGDSLCGVAEGCRHQGQCIHHSRTRRVPDSEHSGFRLASPLNRLLNGVSFRYFKAFERFGVVKDFPPIIWGGHGAVNPW